MNYSRRQLRKRIKSGEKKDQIIENNSSEDKTELIEILASIPNSGINPLYKFLNIFIAIIFFFIIIFDFTDLITQITTLDETKVTQLIKSFAAFIFTLFLFSQLIRFHGKYYLISAGWLALGWIGIIRDIYSLTPVELNDPGLIAAIIFIISINIIVFISLLIIKMKVFPYYSFNGIKTDDNGEMIYQ